MALESNAASPNDAVDATTRWWRDQARSEMGAKYAEYTADRDAGWEVIAASGAEDVARIPAAFRHGPELDALEIGCGIGRLSVNLAPMFRTLLAVDIAGDVVAEAAAHSRHLPNARFEVINGVELLPAAAREFDVVFSAETFHHIQPPVFQRYLDDSFRLLRPGGQIVLHVNVEANTMRARIGQALRRLLWMAGVSTWRGWPTNPGFRRQHYRAAEVLRMMARAGFAGAANLGESDRQMWFIADKPR